MAAATRVDSWHVSGSAAFTVGRLQTLSSETSRCQWADGLSVTPRPLRTQPLKGSCLGALVIGTQRSPAHPNPRPGRRVDHRAAPSICFYRCSDKRRYFHCCAPTLPTSAEDIPGNQQSGGLRPDLKGVSVKRPGTGAADEPIIQVWTECVSSLRASWHHAQSCRRRPIF